MSAVTTSGRSVSLLIGYLPPTSSGKTLRIISPLRSSFIYSASSWEWMFLSDVREGPRPEKAGAPSILGTIVKCGRFLKHKLAAAAIIE